MLISDLVGPGHVAMSFDSADGKIHVRRSFRFKVNAFVPWGVGTIDEEVTVTVRVPEFRGGWNGGSVQKSTRSISVTIKAKERFGESDWQSVSAPGNGWVMLGQPKGRPELPHGGYIRVEVLDDDAG
jgi:hypothetical protein